MKIVFLDYDGVLITARTAMSKQEVRDLRLPELDTIAVGMINMLCGVTSAKVVITTTWREHKDAIQALVRHGLSAEHIHKDYKTRHIVSLCPRGKDIEDWLNLHPETEGYVIFDDDCDFLTDQMPQLIQIDPTDGVSSDNIIKACSVLGFKVQDFIKHMHEAGA